MATVPDTHMLQTISADSVRTLGRRFSTVKNAFATSFAPMAMAA